MSSLVLTDVYDNEVPVIEAIRCGDRFAFAELVRRQKGFVRAAVIGVLGADDRVDDVEQQVWTTFWQRIGKLRDASRWKPWLYRLARNAAIDAGRDTTRRRRRQESAPIDNQPAPQAEPTRVVEQSEKHRTIINAISGLPQIYREPFVLRHVNGWSYAEISEAMQLPIDTVETRLVRARRLLRDALKGKV